ncbi:MAG: hypothetical protein ABIF04_02130 [Chloroflexota bacterium]
MSSLNLTANDIIANVTKKLNLINIQGTREQHGDYWLDGKFEFKVTMPNQHGGSGAISTGFLKVCRNSVFLSAPQYADLVRCPMSDKDYEKIIREKIASRSISLRGTN